MQLVQLGELANITTNVSPTVSPGCLLVTADTTMVRAYMLCAMQHTPLTHVNHNTAWHCLYSPIIITTVLHLQPAEA